MVGTIYRCVRVCYKRYKEDEYKKRHKGIHSSVIIGMDTLIYGRPEQISIGKGTYIQRNCSIVGDVSIGENCAIASNVHIRAETHGEGCGATHKIIGKPIRIGNNVWIGVNAFIREGITIGDSAIIGANAVVTHDVERGSVVGGVPARLLRWNNDLLNRHRDF